MQDPESTGTGNGEVRRRGYQLGFFSNFREQYLDFATRERKARTMVSVLGNHLGVRLGTCEVLNVGSSTGAVDNVLADHVASVKGIDIDREAIELAASRFFKPNLSYAVGDAMNLTSADASVDIVICTHVYEHVPDSERMMSEIYRVLRPGGVCYFGAANRFVLIEPHYGIPFLSWIPKLLANLLMRITGKGEAYYEELRSLASLRRLTRRFTVHDYTQALITDPLRWGTDYMLPPGSLKQAVALSVARFAYGLMPSYIWLLEKPLRDALES